MTSGSSKRLLEPPLRYLTKSLIRQALSCPRKLVYAANPEKYPRQDSIVQDPFAKHLAEEGKRFGDYCRRLFRHGIEIGCRNTEYKSDAYSGDLVAQTHQALSGQKQRVTLFEGAVQYGNYFIRPDILDRIIHNGDSNRPELRLIEVKTKSYDSTPLAKGGQMWNGNSKKTIRSNFLPYIQDVAFQSLVARHAFPEYKVTSWLMLPDRAKKRMDTDEISSYDCNEVPSDIETTDAIKASTAALLNVDELVETALSSKPKYPGSCGQTFQEVVEQWSDQFCYSKDLDKSFIDVPIGSHCASCQFRIKDLPERSPSEKSYHLPATGFDVCWQNATGLRQNELKAQPLVLDLYAYTKPAIAQFIEEKKFVFGDLTVEDFQSKQEKECSNGITSLERQWYQVRSYQIESARNTQYILMKDSIRQEMEKWPYPWHFIDFETSSPVLPYCHGMAPYEILAFQFSHHVIHEDSRDEVHHTTEFLHTERGSCPNEQFLHCLHKALGTKGTVFQWSPFENTVLTSLLSSKAYTTSLTNYEIDSLFSVLRSGNRSMIDLCRLASNYYYVDGSGGSSSIKKLLAPTMNASTRLKELYGAPTYTSNNFTNFQWYQQDSKGNAIDPYKLLDETKPSCNENDELCAQTIGSVNHGGAASTAYHFLQSEGINEQSRKEGEKALLRYCELDTLSMAMMVQAWEGFIKDGVGQ